MWYSAWKASVLGVFLVRMFQHSDWIRRDTRENSKYGHFPCSDIVQRRIKNPDKYLRWSYFVKIINGWKPITMFVKSSILDVWQGSEYTSVVSLNLLETNRYLSESAKASGRFTSDIQPPFDEFQFSQIFISYKECFH